MTIDWISIKQKEVVQNLIQLEYFGNNSTKLDSDYKFVEYIKYIYLKTLEKLNLFGFFAIFNTPTKK